jgi:carboxyl-terminal processing protease
MHFRRRPALALALAFGLGFSIPSAALLAEAPPTTQAQAKNANIAVFDEVWSRVNRSFYDPKFSGLDWKAVGERYRAEASRPGADLAVVVNRMLAELHASHTGYYTPSETAYYDLADIFSGGLREELPKYFEKGEVGYTGIGLLTRKVDGKTFAIGVLDGFPAAAAGLTLGDEIIAVDGKPFEPVASFQGNAGEKVTLTIRRKAADAPKDVIVTPQRLRPNEMYRDAMEKGARIIEQKGRKIGYVHVWSYARHQYQDLLENLIEGKFNDADALVWDLRDGWGGADPDYLDIFNPRSPTMTLTDLDGDRDVVNARWRKPVVLLINGGTRSGKEVLSFGFKKYAYGMIVGEKSAGALLAGRAYMMSNGNLLLLAVTDVSVDGDRLEGRGVMPDITVPFDIRYAGGHDPQLARALDLLTEAPSD